MKKLMLFITMLMLVSHSFAQRDYSKEIVIYFKEGVSQEALKNAPLQKVAIVKSNQLKESLIGMGIDVDRLIIGAPNFKRADTLKRMDDGKVLKRMDMSKLYCYRVPEGVSRKELIAKIIKLPQVVYAHENGTASPASTPSDTHYGKQWALNNTTTPGADINAQAAWDIYTGNASNIIAIIDFGTNASHADLSAKVLSASDAGYSALSHGVQVSGVAAASSNNAQGISGVDWNAKILSKRIDGLNDIDLSQKIYDAVDYSGNVKVINMSFDLEYVPTVKGRYSATVDAAVAYAYKANRTIVASGGNHEPTQPGVKSYPAGFDNVIVVASTDSVDNTAFNSVINPYIDVAAPGFGVLTTSGSGYTWAFGTSIAAPMVSGIASLLKGYNNTLYNDDVENILKLSADDLGPTGFDNNYGHGRVDAGNALNLIKLPNSITHFTSTGGTITDSTSRYSLTFTSVPGFADGNYTVKANIVDKAVTFPTNYCNIISAWGTGVNSIGYRFETINPLFAEGFCTVVPGTLTSTGVTLRTTIYEVFDASNVSMGFYPTTPANVTFGYSILGKKTVDVSMTIEPQLNNGTCGDANVSINTSGGTFVWTVTGDLLINGSGTTLTTTSNAITVTGTSGTITVTGGNCPGLNLSETYTPYKRDIQFSGYLPLLPSDQLSVSISNLNYGVDTFKWYVNNNLVYSGTNDNYCTCNSGPDYRICGINTLRVEADLPCGKTVVIADIEFEQLCGGWFSYYTIYPNPASSNLYIAPNEEKMRTMPAFEKAKIKEYEVSLYDIKGKLRMKAKSSNYKVELDTKNLPSDTYFLHLVKDGDKEVIKKQVMIKN
jgi:hypothetical protein